jgi:ubiquinone/menaquinone biosynthesis C-methylase UbiE
MENAQNKEAEREFFDNVNSTSPWVTFDKNGQNKIFSLFREYVKPQKEEVAVDMGCGTGEFSAELHKMGLTVTGLDISQKSIETCKERYTNEIIFRTEDIENTSFDDNSVDIIFFGGILHHFPNREKVFKEAQRILRKGGRIFAFDPNHYNLIIWTYRELLGVKTQKTENEVLIKALDIEKELTAAQFSQIIAKSTADMTFSIEYFQKLVPFPLYYGGHVYNAIEKGLNIIKPIREKYGSFVITFAKK